MTQLQPANRCTRQGPIIRQMEVTATSPSPSREELDLFARVAVNLHRRLLDRTFAMFASLLTMYIVPQFGHPFVEHIGISVEEVYICAVKWNHMFQSTFDTCGALELPHKNVVNSTHVAGQDTDVYFCDCKCQFSGPRAARMVTIRVTNVITNRFIECTFAATGLNLPSLEH
jgi:hypothetical protein